MKKKITKQTKIIEALSLNPNAADILLDVGLSCIGCSLAHTETLEQGLIAHGLNKEKINKVISKLNE